MDITRIGIDLAKHVFQRRMSTSLSLPLNSVSLITRPLCGVLQVCRKPASATR